MNDNHKFSRKETMWSWIATAAVALMFAISMTGCNTVKGLAKDVYSVTEGIQNEMAEDDNADGSRPSNWE